MDFINAHPGKPWNWYRLSENPRITFEDILANPDKPWSWDNLSANQFPLDRTQQTLKTYYNTHTHYERMRNELY